MKTCTENVSCALKGLQEETRKMMEQSDENFSKYHSEIRSSITQQCDDIVIKIRDHQKMTLTKLSQSIISGEQHPPNVKKRAQAQLEISSNFMSNSLLKLRRSDFDQRKFSKIQLNNTMKTLKNTRSAGEKT
jgi:hypothetical protein